MVNNNGEAKLDVEDSSHPLKVCIIGAGFSGLSAAIRLMKEVESPIFFDIYELSNEVGGTWHSNRYPGCSCDVPIHVYGFSSEKAFATEWKNLYASHEDILEYIKKVAIRHHLQKKIHFNHAVERLEWDDQDSRWKICVTDCVRRIKFLRKYNIVISATGYLRLPKIPNEFLPFTGPLVHTALWDDTVKFEGKDVAVIGTGSSAIQCIPELSKVVKRLYVFQRKPCYVLPKFDLRMRKSFRMVFKWVPGVLLVFQLILFTILEFLYNAMIKGSWTSKLCTKICNWQRRRQLSCSANSKDLYDRLTPDFEYGCKRVAVSSNYYPTFTKEETVLVTEEISNVVEDAIITADGKLHEVDIIVLATGFSTTEYFSPMEIIDKNGKSVLQQWQNYGPSLLMGITNPSLPNLFFLYGPNTSTGHNSVVLTAEIQLDWIMSVIREMMTRGSKVACVRDSVVNEYMSRLDTKLDSMVWNASLCSPWYTDERGRNVAIFPWNLRTFKQFTRKYHHGQCVDFT